VNQVLTDALKRALLTLGRKPQTTHVGPDHTLVESRVGKLLRVYIQIVYDHKNLEDAVVNPVEFQRAGAVAIPWDPVTRKVALVRTNRPIVPAKHVDEYRLLWEEILGTEAPDPVAFGKEVAILLGDIHWQLTQSYGYPPETIEATARRAIESQAGLHVTELTKLGVSYTDTSNRADPVDCFLASVNPNVPSLTLKPETKLCDKIWVNEREFLDLTIQEEGGVPTAFAHSAYTLMKARRIW
jgi:hypothetical protein